MSYHKNKIPQGVYGESSKILEEVHELIDSEEQGNKLMAVNELADIVGAVNGYLNKHCPSFTLADLITMNEATSRAFASGHRKSKS